MKIRIIDRNMSILFIQHVYCAGIYVASSLLNSSCFSEQVWYIKYTRKECLLDLLIIQHSCIDLCCNNKLFWLHKGWNSWCFNNHPSHIFTRCTNILKTTSWMVFFGNDRQFCVRVCMCTICGRASGWAGERLHILCTRVHVHMKTHAEKNVWTHLYKTSPHLFPE